MPNRLTSVLGFTLLATGVDAVVVDQVRTSNTDEEVSLTSRRGLKLAPMKPLNFTALLNGDAWQRKKADLKAKKEQFLIDQANKAEQRKIDDAEKKRLNDIKAKELGEAVNDKLKSLAPKPIDFGKLFPKKAEKKETYDVPPRKTAMCMSGNLRTFQDPAVYKSVRPFLNNIGGIGLGKDEPDLFLYGTLASDSAKHQRHFGFAAMNVTKEDVASALAEVRPTEVKLADEAGEVYETNVDDYIVNRQDCFSSENPKDFWNDIGHMTRSLNQLVHIQRCVDMMVAHEQKNKDVYDAVLIARPDLSYYEQAPSFNLRKWKGKVLHQWDWFMVLPRALANNLTDTSYARPLKCSKGDYCCGYVLKSEAMFEYILGAPMDMGGYSCDCTDKKTPSHLVDVAKLTRTERLD